MQHPNGLSLSPYALAPPPQYSDYTGQFGYSPAAMSYSSATPGPSCTSPAGSSSTGALKHRINLACAYCRRRKIRCTGEANCNNCVRTGRQCIYEQVSEEQNRATKERKAALKSLKIQSLQAQGFDPSHAVSQQSSAALRARGHLRTTSMPYIPTRLAPAAPIQGWTPEGPQWESFAPPPKSAGLSSRPFPSVLTGTPVHAAYIANSGRASPAERQTYSIAVEQSMTTDSATTPPRSRSPSPANHFDAPLAAAYSRVAPPSAGYTSFFPQTPYSPTDSLSASSAFTETSPPTPFSPFEVSFRAAHEKMAFADVYNQPTGQPAFGIQIATPSNPAYGSPQVETNDPSFFVPASPTRKPRHHLTHRATSSLGNPGLGFALPEGFAPGMPVDPAYENAVGHLSNCHIGPGHSYDAGHQEEEVTYSWGM